MLDICHSGLIKHSEVTEEVSITIIKGAGAYVRSLKFSLPAEDLRGMLRILKIC